MKRSHVETIQFAFFFAIALAVVGWMQVQDDKQAEISAAYAKQTARIAAEKKAHDLRVRGQLDDSNRLVSPIAQVPLK